MGEKLELAEPKVTPQIVNAALEIAFIGLYVRPASQRAVVVHLVGINGEREEIRTETATEAITLLKQLNVANLSVKSLERRCMEWVATKRPDLAGTITGTPD